MSMIMLWIIILSIVAVVFWLLWWLAASIEHAEQEEMQFREYIEQMRMYDGFQANYLQMIYDQRYKRG